VPVLLLVLASLYVLYTLVGEGTGEPVTVVVKEGETLSGVAGELKEAGIISSTTLFKLEARARGEDAEIKPGAYRISPGEGRGEIIDKFASGDTISALEVTIPEGLTIAQTAQTIEEQSGIPASEFETAAESTSYGYPFLGEPAKSTEGFLFPKKYELKENTDATWMVERLLEQYSLETSNLDLAGAESRLGLSEYELITVASLVEKESASREERPQIASVIYNRLRAGMPLQIDASVQYALGKPKEKLSLDDLKVESPYNTYKHTGLPPGPIASPGKDSIQAAIEPADTNYLYYVLEADGKNHFFTDDYDEFLEAKKEAGGETTSP
jgi:UPF0755 protein